MCIQTLQKISQQGDDQINCALVGSGTYEEQIGVGKDWIRRQVKVTGNVGRKQRDLKTLATWKKMREEMQEKIQGWNRFNFIMFCKGWGTAQNNSMTTVFGHRVDRKTEEGAGLQGEKKMRVVTTMLSFRNPWYSQVELSNRCRQDDATIINIGIKQKFILPTQKSQQGIPARENTEGHYEQQTH